MRNGSINSNQVLTNVTISGNTATGNTGGGVYTSSGTQIFNQTTLTNNQANFGGGGIYYNSGDVQIGNSIVSGNTRLNGNFSEVFGAVTSLGHNLFGQDGDAGAFGGFTPIASDIVLQTEVTDVLTSLSDNGGSTLTHGLIAGSIAIDAGENSLVVADTTDLDSDGDTGETLPLDQNENTRIHNGTVDIGAVERIGAPPNAPSLTLSSPDLAYVQRSGFALIDDALTIADPDSTTFDSGILMVRVTSGSNGTEQLSIQNNATINLNGNSVEYNGNSIGTLSGGQNASDLTINLNANATLTATQALMQHLSFSAEGDIARTLEITLEDGDGNRSEAAIKKVHMAPVDTSQTFKLHSKPDAKHTIYIDADGQQVQAGSGWNNNESFYVTAWSMDGDRTTFNVEERVTLQQIWQKVAEDYAPFNINVTTEAPTVHDLIKSGESDERWGIRIIMSNDSAITDLLDSGDGGVAKRYSFNWSTDTPAFSFWGDGNAAGTISHEAGHTMGLTHDGQVNGEEYYPGHGEGAASWGSIMGGGRGTIEQWSQGEYYDADNPQDDLATITGDNGFGYRNDEVGDSQAEATALEVVNETQVKGFGIIERNTDADVFSFTTDTGTINLNITPSSQTFIRQNDGSYVRQKLAANSPNLDIWAGIYDTTGNLVAESSPTDSLSAGFTDLQLTEGEYFLKIDGVGVGNPLDNPPEGYTDYGSLGQYEIRGTIIPPSPFDTFLEADLNGDGMDDKILRNPDTGYAFFQAMTPNGLADAAPMGKIGADWTVASVQDLFGDGVNDIIYEQNGTNQRAISKFGSNGFEYSAIWAPNSWEKLAEADFNGDGRQDTLWRKADQFTSLWLMGANGVISKQDAGRVGTDWQVSAVEDVLGNVTPEVVLQKSGTNEQALMTFDTNGYVDTTIWAPANWQRLASADISGDAIADVVWQDDQGWLHLWTMNNSGIDSKTVIDRASGDWTFMGLLDSDGDGQQDDFLWRSPGTGTTAAVKLNNNFKRDSAQLLDSVVVEDWSIDTIADINGDGRDDVLWRNTQTGDTQLVTL